MKKILSSNIKSTTKIITILNKIFKDSFDNDEAIDIESSVYYKKDNDKVSYFIPTSQLCIKDTIYYKLEIVNNGVNNIITLTITDIEEHNINNYLCYNFSRHIGLLKDIAKNIKELKCL